MNHTFFEMFLERLQSRTGSTTQMFLNNFKEIFENEKKHSSSAVKKEYLSKIFLRKTAYVITGNNKVE